MQRITHQQIQKLAQNNNYPSVSMYIPLGGDYYDLRDRLLKAARQARESLLDHVSYDESREIMGPLYSRIHDRSQWIHQTFDKSVAIFVNKHEIQTFALPDAEELHIEVTRGYSVTYLYEQLTKHGRFYTLLLTSKSGVLLQSDVTGVSTVAKVLAGDTANMMKSDLQRAARGRKPIKKFSKRYLNKIDKAVRAHIKDKTAPLVLFGLPQAQSAFREISKYELLMPEGVSVNPEALSYEDVVQRGQKIAQRFYGYYEEIAQDELQERLSASKETVVQGFRAVISALQERRVKTLYIDPTTAVWGERVTFAERQTPRAGDINLTNEAMRAAFESDAEIFHTSKDQAGLTSRTAAILKY